MRFVIFYNDHPKVKGYVSRVWHNFQVHPNFHGEMTHNLFIKHYHINPKTISSMGNVYYNVEQKQWEIEPGKAFVSIKQERHMQDKFLILNLMNTTYKTDITMINYSLQEQRDTRMYQRIKNLQRGIGVSFN